MSNLFGMPIKTYTKRQQWQMIIWNYIWNKKDKVVLMPLPNRCAYKVFQGRKSFIVKDEEASDDRG